MRTVGSVSALDADGRLVAWRLGPDDSCGDVEAWRIGTPTVISFPAQERIDCSTDMIDDFVAVAGDRVAWTSVLDKDAPFGVAVARRVTAAAAGRPSQTGALDRYWEGEVVFGPVRGPDRRLVWAVESWTDPNWWIETSPKGGNGNRAGTASGVEAAYGGETAIAVEFEHGATTVFHKGGRGVELAPPPQSSPVALALARNYLVAPGDEDSNVWVYSLRTGKLVMKPSVLGRNPQVLDAQGNEVLILTGNRLSDYTIRPWRHRLIAISNNITAAAFATAGVVYVRQTATGSRIVYQHAR